MSKRNDFARGYRGNSGIGRGVEGLSTHITLRNEGSDTPFGSSSNITMDRQTIVTRNGLIEKVYTRGEEGPRLYVEFVGRNGSDNLAWFIHSAYATSIPHGILKFKKYPLYAGPWMYPYTWKEINPVTDKAFTVSDKCATKSMGWVAYDDYPYMYPLTEDVVFPRHMRDLLDSWDEYIDTETTYTDYGISYADAYDAAYAAMPEPPYYNAGTVSLSVNNVQGYNVAIREYLDKQTEDGEIEDDLYAGSEGQETTDILEQSWTYAYTFLSHGHDGDLYLREYTITSSYSNEIVDSGDRYDRLAVGDGKFFGHKIVNTQNSKLVKNAEQYDNVNELLITNEERIQHSTTKEVDGGYSYAPLMYGEHTLRDATTTTLRERSTAEISYDAVSTYGGSTVVTLTGEGTKVYSSTGDEYDPIWQMGDSDKEFICLYHHYTTKITENSSYIVVPDGTEGSVYETDIGSFVATHLWDAPPEERPRIENESVSWIAFRTLAAKASYDKGLEWILDKEEEDLKMKEGIIHLRLTHDQVPNGLSVAWGCDFDTHFVVMLATGEWYRLLVVYKNNGHYTMTEPTYLEDWAGYDVYLRGEGYSNMKKKEKEEE